MNLIAIFLGLDGRNVQGEAFLNSFPPELRLGRQRCYKEESSKEAKHKVKSSVNKKDFFWILRKLEMCKWLMTSTVVQEFIEIMTLTGIKVNF